MKNKKRRCGLAAFVFLLVLTAVFFSGCTSFGGTITLDFSGTEEGEEEFDHYLSGGSLMPFENNSSVQLKTGHYAGDLSIEANMVEIVGKGPGKSVIGGDVSIFGNKVVLRNLTINGGVYIKGNNADLRDAEIKGYVRSKGNNNTW